MKETTKYRLHSAVQDMSEAEATDLWIELHADPDLEQIMEEAQADVNTAREALSELAWDPDLLPTIVGVRDAIRADS